MNISPNRPTATPENKGALPPISKTLGGAFGVMMVAVTLASALNYLFSMLMTRMLPEEGAFSAFNSMASIFLIVTMGTYSVMVVIARYVAEFEVTGEEDKTRVLMRSISRWLVMAAVTVLVVTLGIRQPFAEALNLESPWLIVILGVSIAATLFYTMPLGLLQGQQRFVGLGGAHIATAALRIVSGVVMVAIGFGVYGAVGASFVASLIVTGAFLYYYRDIFKRPSRPVEDFRPAKALWYLLPVALTMILLIFLTQIDVVLVKGIFSPAEADLYSYGALAGKAVLFFPEGIQLVMFPRVVELRTKGEPTRRVLGLSILAVAVLVGAVVGFYALFPKFTAYFFAGEKGKQIADIKGVLNLNFVALFGVVMALYALVKLLSFYHLALEKRAFLGLFFLAGVAEVVGIAIFHDSLTQVLTVMLVVGLGLAVSNLVIALAEKSGAGSAENPAVLSSD